MTFEKLEVALISCLTFALGAAISALFVIREHQSIMRTECEKRDGVYMSRDDKCMSKEFFK